MWIAKQATKRLQVPHPVINFKSLSMKYFGSSIDSPTIFLIMVFYIVEYLKLALFVHSRHSIIYLFFPVLPEPMDFSNLSKTIDNKHLALAGGVIVFLYALKQFFNGGVYKKRNIDLSTKTAIVTGGNSGIGAETSKYLARLGCDVIIGARDNATAQAVIKTSQESGAKGKITFIPLDLADTESIKKFADQVPF